MSYEPRELFSIAPQKWVVRQYWDGRVRILDNQSNQNGINMSKIQEITTFMRDDVAAMQAQAEEVHKIAMDVKTNFNSVIGLAKEQLSQAQKDLMELQAALGGTSNFPPQ